jgi:predicted acylesterase/phospholipase RssA/tetratricopeptide (TPR) repeat protein
MLGRLSIALAKEETISYSVHLLMPRSLSALSARAAQVLAGSTRPSAAELYSLANKLREENQIGYSRRLYELAAKGAEESDLRVRAEIKLALSTYKDPDLPIDDRLDTAEAMLTAILANFNAEDVSQRQEALGVLGAIHKQRWAVYGHRDHLDKSYAAYYEGYQLGIRNDLGYTGINTAFVLDLLADKDRTAKQFPGRSSEVRTTLATDIRQEIIQTLPELARENRSLEEQWWFDCTVAEAYLGLRLYEEARTWVQRAVAQKPDNWRLEATARQFAHIVRMQTKDDRIPLEQWRQTQGFAVLQDLLAGDAAAATSFFLGKVGLALSGGGFRASLYHIGVLARLAELDMLRHVEVLSCVSGGSILGTYYYLELRHLLQTKSDQDITVQDYIDIVRRIEVNFLEAVQRNLRTRMLLDPVSNWKALTSRATTTNRLGDLYESELYSRIADDKQNSGKRYVQDLLVQPFGSKSARDFDPRYDNWHRCNKVPILVLNATTLNTCHNWQFTATYMGEPPIRAIDTKIDGNDRLRRMYYEDAPPRYKRIRLGHAVAASACVPGLFDPLVLDDLYEQKYVTKLVDGGAYDNQGVASLREQDCTVLLISDACGQTGIEKEPPSDLVAVSLRSNNILMARSREEQFQLLSTLRDAGLLRGVAYVHLKKDLDAKLVDWIDSPDPSTPGKTQVLTSYGIRKDVQELLATIRTDLDSFSNAEADALMLSGYRMFTEEFAQCITGFPVANHTGNWRFRDIEPVITSEKPSEKLEELRRTLALAHFQPFKAVRLSRGLQVGTGAAVALTASGIGYGITCIKDRTVSIKALASGVAVIGAGTGAATLLLRKVLKNPNPLWQIALSLPLIAVGKPLLDLFTAVVDPIYIHSGPVYRRSSESQANGRSSLSETGQTAD